MSIAYLVKQQSRLLGRLLNTPESRQRFAETLTSSLRRRQHRLSLTRRVLKITSVTSSPVNFHAFREDSLATAFDTFKEDSVASAAIPVFTLARVVSLTDTRAKQGRADIVERNLNLTNAEIRTVEDSTLMGLLRTAATNNPMAEIPSAVLQYRYQHRENPAHILISHEDTPLICHDYIDRETKRKMLKAGVVGYYQGATILRTHCLSKGEMFVLPAPERLGSLLEKDPLTLTIDRDLQRREYLFRMNERIGMVLSNTAVSRFNGE